MAAEIEQDVIAAADTLNLSDLKDKLDSLWAEHLKLLDQYDQAQKQIQKHLSSGFFSLAQASFKSPSKIRYGQDYYDERMQATRGLVPNDKSPRVFTIGLLQEPVSQDTDEKVVHEKVGEAQLATPPASPRHLPESDEKDESKVEGDEKSTDTANGKKPPKQPPNPLHWYGILVPYQLRQAQGSFISAVEGPIGEAVTTAHEMRRLEVEIRKLRKEVKRATKKKAASDSHGAS
ncbi:hypothetical protein AAFC00_005675 [Neodothiora populina]|uniref:Vacuolar ATPase assembly protein VMA22 n=1 Tax=Neodothiora populina TaxID=2781224 RepID=A0ABR3P666_9PEZI